MANNKVSIVFNTSREVLDRFADLAGDLNATNEETLAYLLDFYENAQPEYRGKPATPHVDAALHTCVAPEIKARFKQLAAENGMSFSQMLAALLDEHGKCAGCIAAQMSNDYGTGSGTAREYGAGNPAADGDSLMAQLDAALDTIRDVFRRMAEANRQAAAGRDEIDDLRAQLATAEANAEKAVAARKKLQDTLTRIATQLD